MEKLFVWKTAKLVWALTACIGASFAGIFIAFLFNPIVVYDGVSRALTVAGLVFESTMLIVSLSMFFVCAAKTKAAAKKLTSEHE